MLIEPEGQRSGESARYVVDKMRKPFFRNRLAPVFVGVKCVVCHDVYFVTAGLFIDG
jgi:hypothetical protein